MRRREIFLNILLFFGLIFFCCQKKNNPPETPTILPSPSIGSINTPYSFFAFSQDPDDDSVSIRFDFGDGNISDWSPYVQSGETIEMVHSWQDTGIYYVKAQAKDIKGELSLWSREHQIQITIPVGKTFGGSLNDVGYSVKETRDGGYIIAGYSSSFSGGPDVYLIKTDENCNLQWQKTFGLPGVILDIGLSIAETKDGGYIIAGYTDREGLQVYLIKTDGNGNLEWERTFGGWYDDEGYSVCPTKDGGYIITGFTDTLGIGLYDVYLIKTDRNGNLEWQKVFGGPYRDYGYSVAQTSDGGYIIVGHTDPSGNQFYDIYLIKTDENGNLEWEKRFGGSGYEYGHSVKQTLEGGYIIVGSTSSFGTGGYDVYLIKTDENGNLEWQKTFGGFSDDEGYSVYPTLDSGYIITGYTQSFGAGSYDLYLIKTDKNGNLEWQKTFGGTDEDWGFSVEETRDSGYVVTGYTKSFGAGWEDVYLIKINPIKNKILKIKIPLTF